MEQLPSNQRSAAFSLSASEMEVIKVSAATMLEDEISWLDNFEPSWTSEMETSEADNILLAGHLRLIKTLLSLCGSEKEHLGERAQLSRRPLEGKFQAARRSKCDSGDATLSLQVRH